jgi:hypothetical protein
MNRGNFALEGDEEMKRNCCGLRGRGFDDFSREDLRDIILHKNKVIADLEEHAYGSASWIENLNKGLKKANEIKGKVDKKPPKESEEDFRKRLEGFDKDKDAPTEAWGADELNGGAAAPKAEPKPPSGVAVAAEALKPLREKIQNGIGDAIYGKSDDPRKQKKGLLGISEEDKEESQKKVMKNIVVPIAKTAMSLGKNVKDIANMVFNRSEYDADMKDERIKRIKREEAAAGIVRDKENPMIIIRKPRGYWVADTTDPKEEAYNEKRMAWSNKGRKDGKGSEDVFYIRVPNPIFAAKLRPSFKEFGDAGVDLWTGVQQYDPKVREDVDGTLQRLHDDEFIWIPEDRAKEIYGQLRQFVANKQDEGVMEGYEEEGFTKGQLKQFAKIDPRTLKGQELVDWKQNKLALDKATTRNALEKVTKDIKDEEAKATPDKARLGKMREAKQRVLKRQQELVLRGQQEFKDTMMFQNAEKAKRDAEYYARQKADAREVMNEANADKAEFDAKPVAEKIAILEKLLADPQNNQMEIADYTELLEQLRAEEASEKVEEQAQGSVDLLQQAEVIGAEGGAKPTNPALYEKAKAIVNKSYPKHSAYRSGAYVKKYKEMGGEYEDEPDGKRPLERWFKEDWKDVGNKEYPVYRPTKRISKDTPLTPDEIDPENLKLQVKEKQKIKGERNLSAFKKRGGADSESDDEELVGSGAVEYTLQKAGMRLFNPSGDMTMAGRQSFTPDYDAYGETVEEGRKNAFNLSRSMYDQSKAIELPDFKLIRDDTSLRFYRKEDENVILVGIRGTDVKSWTDLYTWAVIGANQDLRMTTRFQEDLAKMIAFQRNYPPSQFYYVATGSSLAGSIADRFLELGLIEEAITYNPSIERKYVLEEGILNHRVYLDTDPLFMLMGQYAPNTEIRVNPNKTNFYNPSKEKDYLIASHSIYPIYNPAFEGGGMEGSGKTYTIEEWKAIFDAKLEEKRKAIEAREAKKKQTAKAKRERAKARRDARDEPPPLETPFRTSRTMKATPPKEPEPEEEEPEVEVAEYEMGGETYLVEEPRKGLAFAERRVFDSNNEEIGNLTEDDVGKTLVKMVMRREKIGAFADKSPKAKSSSESLPSFESKKPKEPEKEEAELDVTEYTYRKKIYLIEDPKGEEDMNLEFYANRKVFDDDDEELGKLGDDNPLMKGLMKLVIKQEFPSQKDYRETMGLDAKKPRASKAPASARVELREELVAEQPRSPAGEFVKDAEPLQLVVAEVKKLPQRDYMKLMKSPAFTGAERRLLGLYLSTPPITSKTRTKLMARSGLARKLMELLGIDESAFQTRRDRLKIADTVEKRVEGQKGRDVELAPIMDLFDKQEAGLIRFMATLTGKNDGKKILTWINQVAKRFADAAIGTWVVAERILAFGRSDGWSCDGRNDLIERPAKVDESSGGEIKTSALMFLTEADENNVTCMGFVAGQPRFGLNFSDEKSSDNFFFPQMTEACMKMVEKIDGVDECYLGTRRAGMGNKRRREWRFSCKEVEPAQQRLKPERKKEISRRENEKMKEIAGKVGALVAEYKDIIIERGELMVKRVEASLTPQQKKLIGRGMKGGARPQKQREGNPPILGSLYDTLAAWDRPIDFGDDQAAIDTHAATVQVPDVSDFINDQSLVGTPATMKAGQIKMKQLKQRLPAQIRSDMYYDDNYDGEDWAGFANYHYQQLQLLRYLENMFPDDPARVMNIHERWSADARRAGGFSGSQFQYYMG